VLDQLQNAAPAEDSTSIAEYRVFCLLALDRRDEARKSIDDILHNNPHYLPSADQASPRIQSVFRDVRRQSLPKIVMERYAAAIVQHVCPSAAPKTTRITRRRVRTCPHNWTSASTLDHARRRRMRSAAEFIIYSS
jgi:hypothetical protein